MAPPRLLGLPPALDARTRLLVLGSFPGAASLQAGQYYAHPQNQLWRLLGAALGDPGLPALPYPERLAALQARGVGLWDVYAACAREGSLDQDIRAAELNDLAGLGARCPDLRVVAHNGGESWRHRRYTAALAPVVLRLPSSSPAAAAWSFARKLEAWSAAVAQAGLGG